MSTEVQIGITNQLATARRTSAAHFACARGALRTWEAMFGGRSFELGASVGGAFAARLHLSGEDDVALALLELDRELQGAHLVRAITQRPTERRARQDAQTLETRLQWRSWLTRTLVGKRGET